ncbi:hypothetical protein BDQ17DRAFT_1440433 [Cyathus striatus]|nr:hypothetical protein BDQ17DRAFT_1440433 [Cyathus striatus]
MAYNSYTFGFRMPHKRHQQSAGNIPFFLPPSPTSTSCRPTPEAHLSSTVNPHGFGTSSSTYPHAYESPPPYSMNPFGMINDHVTPSPNPSPLSSVHSQDMKVYLPDEYTTSGESYASTLVMLVDLRVPGPGGV